MTTEINLGNLVIPIIKPEKGKDYYTDTEKQDLISIVTNNVNSVILPQEQTRQENEATRESNEETRQSQENTRQSNEVSRQTAESTRVEAENLRQSNETSRISAEQTRVETFNTQMQAVDTAIGGIHTSQDAYDQNAQAKTEAFNTNATNKINVYNENASEKIDEYDQHVHDYETELANKVDKVPGKDLSTNDYDNTEKGKVQANTEARHTHSNKSVLDGTTASYTTEKDQKLDGLENYDDTELREDIEQNRTSIEENYKVITKLQEDVEDLTERVEDAENNQLTYTPTPATSHYLQDSADSRFRKFIPIGRSVQDGDPTPENPIEIKNTGDNGSVNEKVQNKNLFDVNLAQVVDYFITPETGEKTLQNNNCNSDYIPVKENTTYARNKIVSSDGYTFFSSLSFYDENKKFLSGQWWSTATFQTPVNTKYILLSTSKNRANITEIMEKFLKDFQLEQGSTATDYVPHSEQNISFPLSQGQKLYQDEELKENGKDDIWEEKVYDGTETEWGIYNSNNNRTVFQISVPSIENYSSQYIAPDILSSHFKAVPNSKTWEPGDISRQPNTDKVCITMQANMTVNDLKSYLAEQYANGTPVTIVYKKANPTITPYTEEQQRYYDEHIKPLRTYKNVTHISSEDETPANVEVEYVQDTKTYIDNKVTALTNAITSLGGNV